MKTAGITLIFIGLIFAGCRGIFHFYVKNQYEVTVQSYWDLSVKASTIEQKSEYMDLFIQKLDAANLSGTNSALFFETPNTDFDANFKAAQSLQIRLRDIQSMDPNSFEYQTAMQQITEHEQNEAGEMLDVLKESWKREHYYTTWNPVIITVFVIVQILLCLIGYAIWES